MKWQTTLDKIGQLTKEHERCERIKTELKTDLRHITQQWINEKRKRQNTELERDFYVNAFDYYYHYFFSLFSIITVWYSKLAKL